MPLNLFRTQSIQSPPFSSHTLGTQTTVQKGSLRVGCERRSLWNRQGNYKVLKQPSDTLRETLHPLTNPDSKWVFLLGSLCNHNFNNPRHSFTHEEPKRFYLTNKSTYILLEKTDYRWREESNCVSYLKQIRYSVWTFTKHLWAVKHKNGINLQDYTFLF